MLTVCAIASGSNGNCYYIGNSADAVLIDAGISARQIIARMHLRNLDPSRVKAIFISHEHTDHTSGTRVLSKRLRIPVYVTAQTYTAMYPNLRPSAPRFFKPGCEINVGDFSIYPFSKLHDAAEPCSFRVSYKGVNTGVFTDIGSACDHVVQNLILCDVVFLESNYDEKMLWNGKYPWPLKKRIASEYGHLSNDQAYDLLVNNPCSKLRELFLSHLSAENNTPETAYNRFSELSGKINVHLTSRYEAGEVYRIRFED